MQYDRISKLALVTILSAGLSTALVAPTTTRAAIISATHTRVIKYSAGMTSPTRSSYPYTANIVVNIHPNGIVDGTWTSDSIRPDPMNGRPELITGGITGNYLHFSVGVRGSISVKAQFIKGDVSELSGSAYFRHKRYDFVAHRSK